MAHRIIHIELSANDHHAAAQWYAEVFGWTVQDFPDMNYSTFTTGENEVGGGFNPVQNGAPAGAVLIYLLSEDLAADVSRVAAHGGKIVMPRQEIPGVGDMATFYDPTGNLLALLQPSMGG